ncbi:glycerophosphodiester phosphodiesterase [Thalassotalea sp. HSM 43]|uniref:glycerophosphodiester phosphodiesterase n=1 Tax=Thalassotalea sp. HSM 43 TaxID=2552945 RepID=UPI001081DDE0|nr:glycerophosphodiester phosphodiesterase family protein [Thalassotalea sp. HSM 43]QBY04646.1 glycerophosphodiester phosphodiesterase [Thalassotalea sp. HSM 43]
MLVLAHRGASGHEPENTLLAIENALQMQVDAIEIDVHWADGELVVIHDRKVDKTTDGQGQLKNLSFAQIRQLDAGKGQQIPTLDEVLELIQGKCPVNIELKADNTVVATLSAIDKAVQEYGFDYDQFLLSSFNHHLLLQIKSLNKAIDIGALTASCPVDYAAFAQRLNAYSVHISVDFINQAFVDDAHQRGLKVYVYTVDDEEDIIAMHQLGVDAIFSNYPTRSLLKIAHLKGAPKSDAPIN